MRRYDVVIFDLDGTVLDTLDDLAFAANRAMKEAGYPERDRESVRRSVGHGISRLIGGLLPDVDAETAELIAGRCKMIYQEEGNERTRPYPGVGDMLREIKSKGIEVAVLTNKIQAAADSLLEAHFPGLIDIAIGEREGLRRKPAPDGVFEILKKCGVAPEKALYVGDSEVDVETAKNAGVEMVWVSWGFRTREEMGLMRVRSVTSCTEIKNLLR